MAEAPAGGAAARPTPAQPGPDPLIGRVINDRFRIVAMMAKGGMGKVYRAEQAPLGREVALKVLNPSYNGDQDPEFHKRFFLEASTCSKLTHPNTVTIFDYGRSDDGVFYIAMELLEGRTLHRTLRDEGPFAPARALHITRQVARSLREAHALGVIHRDLKPANVFLVRHGDESDFVKVLDFGLVKAVDDNGEDLTQTGLFMGSPKYMSPEQIRGERADARADIYSLGVMLYEMLTGKVPFERSSSVNTLMAHVHEPPPPFAVTNPNLIPTPALEAVVMRALSKTADERHGSMDELLVALKSLSTESGSAFLGSSGSRPSIETGSTGQFDAQTSALGKSSPSGASVAISPSVPPSAVSAVHGVVPADRISTLPPAGERNRRTRVVGATVASVALLAGVWWFLGGGAAGTPEAPVRELATAPAAAPLVAPARSPEPARPLATTLTLTSEPPGATVRVGNESYGPTPVEVLWEGESATRGRELTFLFELENHHPVTVLRTLSGETLEVSAALERLPAARPIRPRPPRGDDDDDGPVGPVHGYKTDPY